MIQEYKKKTMTMKIEYNWLCWLPSDQLRLMSAVLVYTELEIYYYYYYYYGLVGCE